MSNINIGPETIFHIGPFGITDTTLTSFGILVFLSFVSWLFTHFPQREHSRLNTAVQGIILALENALLDVLPKEIVRKLMPFIGTLWAFVLIANLCGLIPGLHSPTRDISITSALAIIVFFATHGYGIQYQGYRRYLKHYIEPNILLLPFNIISELTRTLAMAIRLFGNMMSLETAALLVLLVAGFLVPIPILMLHIIEAVVQAYIFGVLALIYIAGALERLKPEKDEIITEEKKP